MSVRLARMACLGFAGISAVVACNVLLLQPGRMPSREEAKAAAEQALAERSRRLGLDERPVVTEPGKPARPGTPEAQRVARHAPLAANLDAESQVEARGPAPPELVRQIQKELSQRGYDPGSIDGTLGHVTRAAIMAFEHDQLLVISGEPSEPLLKAVRAARTVRQRAPAAGEPPPRRGAALEVTRMVQDFLLGLGYEPGKSDGQMQAATERAIREFELDHGLVASGRISGELMQRIVRAAATRRGQARR